MSAYTSITARISHEDKALLDELVANRGITISELIRLFVRGECKQVGLEQLLIQQNEMLEKILKFSIRGSIAMPIFQDMSSNNPDTTKLLREKINTTADGVLSFILNPNPNPQGE